MCPSITMHKLIAPYNLMQSLLSLEYLIIVPISKNFNHDDGKQGQISSNYANQFDVVIDATGNPNGLTLAMSLFLHRYEWRSILQRYFL